MTPTIDPDSPAERTENYLEAYSAIGEWIRFADAKAAVVLTVVGALASVLIPTLTTLVDKPDAVGLYYAALGCFAIWALLMLLSGAFAVWCVLPLRRKGKHPALNHCQHFHPAAISVAYKDDEVERFINDCQTSGVAGFERQVLAGLLIDSHISSAKYGRVARSIRMLTLGAPFGFAYLVLIQFL
tara:strand:+ start:7017 stop:7571 length:555 start_codon:yes stop_codon:yes gene_type:complete